jgi:hypothetical protein
MRSTEIDCIAIKITIRIISSYFSTDGIITPIYVRHYESLLLEPCQVDSLVSLLPTAFSFGLPHGFP